MDNQQSTSSLRLEASGILRIAIKWLKPLIIITLVSAILATIFSSPAFIKPLFKSRAIVYPSNITAYATENTTEQLIQIFQSEDIRDRLIRDFHLFKHYEIDSAHEKYPVSLIKWMMSERIKISKTEYESAEIEVFDTDPVTAALICDSMISYGNQKTKEMQREKYGEVVNLYKTQMDIIKHEMDSMEAAIKNLRTEYGIFEFEEQIKPFSKAYYSELSSGKSGSGNSALDKVKNNLAEKGGEYISLKEHLFRIRGTYNDVKVSYENAMRDFTREFTFCNVVTKPVPAEKKSYPVRSLIILGFTAAMLFISFLVIVIIEKNRESRIA